MLLNMAHDPTSIRSPTVSAKPTTYSDTATALANEKIIPMAPPITQLCSLDTAVTLSYQILGLNFLRLNSKPRLPSPLR